MIKYYLLAAGSLVLLLIFGRWWIYSDAPTAPAATDIEMELGRAEPRLPASLAVENPARSNGVQTAQRPFAQVSGRIFSASGAPLAGVLVSPPSGWGEPAVSDGAGHYRIAVSATTDRHRDDITYQREGFRERRLNVRLDENNLSELMLEDVSLEPLGPVVQFGGLIRNDKGVSVSGETVHLYSPTLEVRQEARSDEYGEFKFSRVYAAPDYRLWIYAGEPYLDYEATKLELAAEPTYLEIVLESSITRRLEGRMVNTEGYGVSNQVLLLESGETRARAVTITGDAEGYFSAGKVPSGVLSLNSRAAPYLAVDGIELGAGGKDFVEITLDLGDGTVAGRVLDSYGNPVADAEIRMDWLQSYGPLRSRSRRFRMTDENGAFSFNGLGKGSRRIGVKAPGFLAAGVMLETNSTWLEIRLEEN